MLFVQWHQEEDAGTALLQKENTQYCEGCAASDLAKAALFVTEEMVLESVHFNR